MNEAKGDRWHSAFAPPHVPLTTRLRFMSRFRISHTLSLPLVCPHISFLPLTGDCDSFSHTRYCLGGEFPLPHFHFILNPPLSPFSFEASSSLSSFISIPGERGESRTNGASASEASTSEVSLRERSERLYIHYLHRFISHIHLRPKVQSSFKLTFPPLSVLL